MKVLFVCNANMNRSQIAMAIFNRLSKKNQAISAGLSPGLNEGVPVSEGHFNPIEVMKEYGYDLSKERMKRITAQMIEGADVIVIILNKKKYQDLIPENLKRFSRLEWWDIDSISEDIQYDEYVRLEKIRIKRIEECVRRLIKEVDPPSQA